jgi:hypothetical protein
MHAAIERATAHIGFLVEREVSRRPPVTASPPFVDTGVHDRALEVMPESNRISGHERIAGETERYLRPMRLVESWRPPNAEDRPKHAALRNDQRLRLKPRDGESDPLSRVS